MSTCHGDVFEQGSETVGAFVGTFEKLGNGTASAVVDVFEYLGSKTVSAFVDVLALVIVSEMNHPPTLVQIVVSLGVGDTLAQTLAIVDKDLDLRYILVDLVIATVGGNAILVLVAAVVMKSSLALVSVIVNGTVSESGIVSESGYGNESESENGSENGSGNLNGSVMKSGENESGIVTETESESGGGGGNE